MKNIVSNRKMKVRLIVLVCLFISLIAVISHTRQSEAQIGNPAFDYVSDAIAYDGFATAPNSSLDNAEGGDGWSGDWAVEQNNAAVKHTSGNLSYGNLPVDGNSLVITHATEARNAFLATRYLQAPITSGDVWLSYRVRADNVGNGHFFVSTSDNLDSGIGKSWGRSFSIHNARSAVQFTPNQTYLLVAKYVLNPTGDDQVYMWVNPVTMSEPNIADADLSVTTDIGAIDRININVQDHGLGAYLLDEIRISTEAPLLTLVPGIPGDTADVTIIPQPQSITVQSGSVEISSNTDIFYDTRSTSRNIENSLRPLANVLSEDIELLTGVRPNVINLSSRRPDAGDIVLQFESISGNFAETEAEENQAHTVSVTDRVTIRSQYYKGVAYGVASLIQAIDNTETISTIPQMQISDSPADAYRTVMIDIARKQHSIGTLEEVINMSRLYKVRYVQIHLSDDQNFTFPFAPVINGLANNGVGNYHFSRQEWVDLVAYADARGVTLVPELDLPGHSTKLIQSGYLTNDPTTSGFSHGDVASPLNHDKIEAIIDDMLSVFQSSPYFHIGGDESNAGSRLEPFLVHINGYLRSKPDAQRKRMLVWEGFGGAPTDELPATGDDRIIVISWESDYNPPWDLLSSGYTVVNASWEPLYVVRRGSLLSRGNANRMWSAEDIFAWDSNTFMHFHPRTPLHKDLGPSDENLQDSKWKASYIGRQDQVIGGQLLFWEQTETWLVKDLGERLPAFSQKLWNPNTTDSYSRFAGKTNRSLDRILTIVRPVEILPETIDPNSPISDHFNIYEGDSVEISFRNRTKINGTIRYELGSVSNDFYYFQPQGVDSVTTASRDTSQPVVVDGAANIRARLFRPNGTPVNGTTWEVFNNWPQRARVTYYELGRDEFRGSTVPDFGEFVGTRPIIKTAEVPAIRGPYIHDSRKLQQVEATLRIENGGRYTIAARTRSGNATVYLDLNQNGSWEANEAILQNTLNTEANLTTELNLTAGDYLLRVDHKAETGGPVLLVSLDGPDTGDALKDISEYLVPLNERPLPPPDQPLYYEENATAYDSFVTSSNSSLDNAGGGEGWSGDWTVEQNNAAVKHTAGNLSYDNLPVDGNVLAITHATEARNGFLATRYLQTPITSGDVWLSYRVRADNVGNGHFFVSASDNLNTGIGKAWGSSFSIHNTRSSVQFAPNQTYLIVAKYVLNPTGDDQIYMWVNPVVTSEPNIADADLSVTTDIDTIDRININVQDHGLGKYLLDEIRIGYPVALTSAPPPVPTAIPLPTATPLPTSVPGDTADVTIIPQPQSITVQSGSVDINSNTDIFYDTRSTSRNIENSLRPLANILSDDIELLTGVRPDVINLSSGSPSAGDIVLQFESISGRIAETEAEENQAHTVSVTDRVTIRSQYYKGVSYGVASLLQAIDNTETVSTIPQMQISDRPADAYRTVMIDIARKQHSIGTLEEVINMSRLYKVRYVQIHLSDDQNFTFPFAPVINGLANNGVSNYHFSRQEWVDLVAYADARGVTLVPELDLPGHSTRLLKSGYLTDDPAIPGFSHGDVASPLNYGKIEAIVDDLLSVFQSSPYFHIGGDESTAGSRLEPFLAHINEHLRSKPDDQRKRMLVWEGFGGAPTDELPATGDDRIIVLSWESSYNTPWNLLQSGYTVVNASWKPLYVVGRGSAIHPGASTRMWSAEEIFSWDSNTFMHWEPGRPVYQDSGPSDPDRQDSMWKASYIGRQNQVIGGQLLFWEQTEVWVIDDLSVRLPAFSEKLWNRSGTASFDQFESKQATVTERVLTLVRPIEILPNTIDPDSPASLHYNIYEGDDVTISFRNRTKIDGTIRYELGGINNDLTFYYPRPIDEVTASSTPYNQPFTRAGAVGVRARLFRADNTPVNGTTWEVFNNWPQRVRVTYYERGRDEFAGSTVPDFEQFAGRRPVLRTVELPALRGPFTHQKRTLQQANATLRIDSGGSYVIGAKTQSGHATVYIDLNQNGRWETNEAIIQNTPNTEVYVEDRLTLSAGDYALRVDHKAELVRPVLILNLNGPDTGNVAKEISPYLAPLNTTTLPPAPPTTPPTPPTSGAIAYDSFTTAANNPLNNAGGGNGWSDNWTVDRNDAAATHTSGSLSYDTLPVDGNALAVTHSAEAGNAFVATRYLQTPISSGNVWLAYRVDASKVGVGHFFVSASDNLDSGIGKAWGSTFSIHNDKSSTSFNANETYLLVARYVLNPNGDDQIYMWVNPDTSGEPSIVDATIATTNSIDSIDRININIQDYGLGQYTVDEIRFGSSWGRITSTTP